MSSAPANIIQAYQEILQSLVVNWRLVLVGAMLVTMTTVTFYMITAYTPTFGHSVLHLADIDNLTVTLCVGISNLFLASRHGRSF